MKDVLLIGKIGIVSNALLQPIEGKKKIVLCGDTFVQKYQNKNVVCYPFRENDDEYRGIYKSYNFDTVVYFSQVLDGQKRLYNELENLENALYSATLNGVEQFIYLTSNDYVEEAEGTRTKLLKTSEEICRQFVDEHNINVLVLRVPYLYTKEETTSRLTQVLKKVRDEQEIVLDGRRGQTTDFLCDEDLGELLRRILDEPMTGFHVVNVSGGNGMEFAEAGELITKATDVSKISYKEYGSAVPTCVSDGILRETYGWFPTHLLEDDVSEIYDELIRNENNTKVRKVRNKLQEKVRNFLFVSAEMAFTFLVAELLNTWTGANFRMDYVDFRLLFVVIIGTMHGTGAGIIASVLACFGYFYKDLSIQNWEIVFFNIENWLPFAAYFLAGTIVGHIRDKNKEEVRFLNEQQEILEQKYNFLSELYTKTLENKEEFSRQIIGYEDSFGKLYQVVRKLNSVVADDIFFEAVFAIEEILKTHSAAIYTIGKNSHFARLNVCSREVNEKLSKSMDLKNFPAVYEALKENRNWYNAEGLQGYPAYVAPVSREGSLHGAIVIWNASATQMRMDFYNKFSILSGLVQDALIRAIVYGEEQASKQMMEGTRILKAQFFEELISAKEKMGKEGMTDYVLLQIDAPGMNLEQISDAVSSGIRDTDNIGMRADENVYLLLSQTNEKSMEIIKGRLAPKGIKLTKK